MKGDGIMSLTGKRMVKVGIFGAPINNGNMGCLALTYSLLAMLEKISRELGIVFTYYDFEGVEDSAKTQMLCSNLGIEEERVKSFNVYPVESFLGLCHRPHKVYGTILALKECDLFIDLTQGDSFSDIYGNSVFNRNANGKLFVVKRLKKPLILGPQTYGPYQKNENKKKAKRAIDGASLVISRDKVSAHYLKTFTDKKVYVTTDLAFGLPYKKSDMKHKNMTEHRKIKVGVNVSGLLSKNKIEKTPTEFQLKTDYDSYIDSLLSWLVANDYEVSLIPHVIADYECGKQIIKKYPKVILVDMYQTPIDIKSKISEFDVFIGARMHATIGAFSSGVATIPTAYSRKFNGLYESVAYPYIIDLLNFSTEENLEKTKKYVENYEDLRVIAQESMENINQLENETVLLIKEQVLKQLRINSSSRR